MNHNDNDKMQAQDHGDDMPDALRWQLRGLRRDAMPQRDLWADIAGRISAQAPAAPSLPSNVAVLDRRPRALGWLAMAASVAIALGIGWQMRPAALQAPPQAAPFAQTASDHPNNPTAALISREAAAMTWEYKAALREIDAQNTTVADAGALKQLDRSAALVRSALAQDPEARFLLERLQKLYAQRLALTQRLALS
ncbi:hypothetical protein M2650_02240 [Luteimonas sp. SX5]|uniref:Anti-sigma factor n=1 Tax=Luteimonas galliterrae TaxID=2940486 RepID=A0ABT0MF30_9GAMM|nr:hypothetical protein [Luteimonas galliterrae]MCL1633468.1 hypothetical protein [Luteimonas galliterrae]